MDTQTAHALIRFGLGRRGSEPLPADPVAWLRNQIEQPDPISFAGLPSATDGLIAWRDDTYDPIPVGQETRLSRLLRAETQAQTAALLTSPAPYRERLVLFWANHFTVSLFRPELPPVIGAYMREAIRPHVTGRFTDMVLAVVQHPALQLYLDNWMSVGPDSVVGRRTGDGINENLGREFLELHTISPAAGYSQADVTAMANVLTGWTLEMTAERPRFAFDPQRHQPGPKTVMGQVFPAGQQGGIQALEYFADHPATHRFLATKLCRHFIADAPAPEDVARIEGVLRDTHGDLSVVALELVSMPAAWQAPLSKFRTGTEYAVAVLRAVDLPPDRHPDPVAAMRALGQPWWTAPQPNGWSDQSVDWIAQVSLTARAEWAADVAGRAQMDSQTGSQARDPVQLAHDTLGPLVRPATLSRMRAAGSRQDALTLLLASPEFMRR